MRRLAPPPVPALLFALVLPGCVSSPGDEPPAPASGPGAADAPIPWSLTDCAFLVAFVPVPEERLAPFLPEGFALSTGGGPLSTVRGGAYLGVEAFQCASGAGLDGEVAPIEYGSFFTSVEPPEAIAVEADGVYLKWDVLVPDAPRREALLAHGLPARAGSATLERPVGAGPGVRATLVLDGVGSFRVEGVTQGSGGLDSGTFVEYAPREDGGVGLWRAGWDTQTLERGQAVVAFEPGSWAAEAAGERATGGFITGTWSFADGAIAPRLPWTP